MSSRMKEIIDEASAVHPVIVVDGRELYTAEDAQKINKAKLLEQKAVGSAELGQRQMNPDGTVAASRAHSVAVDPSIFFENRYRKSGTKEAAKYEIVTDYRAIKEQSAGHVYTDNIIAHVISKDADGSLVLEQNKVIGADEFVREFKGKLDIESMTSIYNLIKSAGIAEMSTGKLEF